MSKFQFKSLEIQTVKEYILKNRENGDRTFVIRPNKTSANKEVIFFNLQIREPVTGELSSFKIEVPAMILSHGCQISGVEGQYTTAMLKASHISSVDQKLINELKQYTTISIKCFDKIVEASNEAIDILNMIDEELAEAAEYDNLVIDDTNRPEVNKFNMEKGKEKLINLRNIPRSVSCSTSYYASDKDEKVETPLTFRCSLTASKSGDLIGARAFDDASKTFKLGPCIYKYGGKKTSDNLMVDEKNQPLNKDNAAALVPRYSLAIKLQLKYNPNCFNKYFTLVPSVASVTIKPSKFVPGQASSYKSNPIYKNLLDSLDDDTDEEADQVDEDAIYDM
jgi:hypothetical protein